MKRWNCCLEAGRALLRSIFEIYRVDFIKMACLRLTPGWQTWSEERLRAACRAPISRPPGPAVPNADVARPWPTCRRLGWMCTSQLDRVVSWSRRQAHRWRCVGTLTSPHRKWVYVDRILLAGWACSWSVFLWHSPPSRKEHCQGRLTGWTNRRGGAWSGTKIAAASLFCWKRLLCVLVKIKGTTSRAVPRVALSLMKSGWKNQHACAQRKHTFVSSRSGVERLQM